MLVVKNRLEIKDFTLALERGMNVDTNTATSMVMFRTVTPKTVYGVWFSDPEDCILFGSKLSRCVCAVVLVQRPKTATLFCWCA